MGDLEVGRKLCQTFITASGISDLAHHTYIDGIGFGSAKPEKKFGAVEGFVDNSVKISAWCTAAVGEY